MVSLPAVMECLCEGSESELIMDLVPAILCLSLLPDRREPGDCWSGVKLTQETGSVPTADPTFVLRLCGAGLRCGHAVYRVLSVEDGSQPSAMLCEVQGGKLCWWLPHSECSKLVWSHCP